MCGLSVIATPTARIIAALLAAFAGPRSTARAQRPDDLVARHRAVYANVERSRAGYRHAVASMDSLGLEQQSAEGGKVEAYCERDSIRLLVASYYGETGDATDRFYFDHDSLLFALSEVRRGLPNGRDPYPKRTIVEQQRFYFTDGRLVRWLGNSNAPRSVTSREARRHTKNLMNDVRRFRAVMPACRPKYARR